MAERESRSDAKFRREAALAILGAYVHRHGGFSVNEQVILMKKVWEYADLFVDMEDSPPMETILDQMRAMEQQNAMPEPRRRKAAPNDEYGVRDGDTVRRGFVSYEEAEFYASARPGAKIFQVSGDGMLPVADPDAA